MGRSDDAAAWLSLAVILGPAAVFGLGPAAVCGQSSPGAQPSGEAIAYVPVEGASISGPLSVANGRAAAGNNSTVTAGDKSVPVTLARGGSLRICASTSVHLSRDAQPLTAAVKSPARNDAGTDDAGLMIALDRGAIEANYAAGKYSDVVLTPDLRILISGPGTADLRLRVSRQGDTCIDNRGYSAPYVTVSSLMDGGVYRVQPNQHVLFEHGSLQQVVDNEREPCGCPDAQPDASGLLADKRVGGPSSTPADTAFPTAVSEGLAAPPAQSSTPAVPVGQAHAQVTASLSNDTPPGPPPPGADAAPATATPAQPGSPVRQPGLFHRLGHLFARLFGSS